MNKEKEFINIINKILNKDLKKGFVVGIGDSKEWKNEQDIDASGNVVVVRQEVIKGIKVCNENGNIEAVFIFPQDIE